MCPQTKQMADKRSEKFTTHPYAANSSMKKVLLLVDSEHNNKLTIEYSNT